MIKEGVWGPSDETSGSRTLTTPGSPVLGVAQDWSWPTPIYLEISRRDAVVLLRGKRCPVNTHRTLLVGTVGLVLFGCASMNKSECLVSDWQMIGYEDGARGYGTDRLSRHRKACAKHSVVPDLAGYQEGRLQGLQEYCQPTRGFALGNSGANYGGVCPTELEADFLDAYNSGHHLRQLRASVANAKGQISSKKRALKKVKQDLVKKEAALISDETTSEVRLALLAEVKDLSESRGQLQAEIEDLIVVRTRREEALTTYKAELNGDY